MSSAPLPANPFIDFLERYKNDPVLFVKECCNAQPDDWQAEFLEAIARGHRRVSVRSGHGVGKSTAASWAILWYLLTRYTVKILVTAPSSGQLFDALYAETKRWAKELPENLSALLDVKSDRIELVSARSECFVSLKTSRPESPEALQGAHADNVMLIADEASGVHEAVFEAAAGSMSSVGCTILLGNPTRTSGFFYDTHTRLRDQWWTKRVSCVASPRVSREYIAELQARYGEDSNAYRVRVLGEFPESDDDTIISIDLIQSALSRDVALVKTAPVVWGLDVARYGNDASALCKRQGNHVTEPTKRYRGLDLMSLCGVVMAEYEALEPGLRPVEINVDSIGLGAGVTDRLIELKLPARGINVSESPSLGNTYRNLRAEIWYKAKAWFEGRDVHIPDDDQLIAELSAVRYKFLSTGKIQIESKDDMRKRGMPSPDVADAFCLTFAGTATTAAFGRRNSGDWQTAIKRNLPRVRRR